MGEVKAVEEYEKGVILGDKFCDLELCESGFTGQIIGDLMGGVFRKYDNWIEVKGRALNHKNVKYKKLQNIEQPKIDLQEVKTMEKEIDELKIRELPGDLKKDVLDYIEFLLFF